VADQVVVQLDLSELADRVVLEQLVVRAVLLRAVAVAVEQPDEDLLLPLVAVVAEPVF
jgi:hypothetical protein